MNAGSNFFLLFCASYQLWIPIIKNQQALEKVLRIILRILRQLFRHCSCSRQQSCWLAGLGVRGGRVSWGLTPQQSLRTATAWLQSSLFGSPSHTHHCCSVVFKHKCLQCGWNNKTTWIKYRKALLFFSFSLSCEGTSKKNCSVPLIVYDANKGTRLSVQAARTSRAHQWERLWFRGFKPHWLLKQSGAPGFLPDIFGGFQMKGRQPADQGAGPLY